MRRAAAAGRDHTGHSVDLQLASSSPWRPLLGGREGPLPEDSLVFSASAAETSPAPSTPAFSVWEQHLERRRDAKPRQPVVPGEETVLCSSISPSDLKDNPSFDGFVCLFVCNWVATKEIYFGKTNS